MSKFMINDEALINDINPFVEFDFSLPGAWSKPPQYATGKLSMDKETVDSDQTSPICDFGITSGNRTIDWCRRPPENCPLNRMWEPQRLWDPEFYVPPQSHSRSSEQVGAVRGIEKDLLLALIFLFVFYAMLDMTRK
jgi:hypothetical protein